ncbi:MAG: tetratricopeptide repeat protein, partial [Acidobacteriota bacterium]
ALRLQPESVQALAAMAEAELGMSELAAAERHAARVLDREPSHGIASLVMGMIRLEQRDYESARDHLIEAVTTDPESPKAHYQLSLAYARLGDMEMSREHRERYRSALETMERQLEEVRSRLGIQKGGMQP